MQKCYEARMPLMHPVSSYCETWIDWLTNEKMEKRIYPLSHPYRHMLWIHCRAYVLTIGMIYTRTRIHDIHEDSYTCLVHSLNDWKIGHLYSFHGSYYVCRAPTGLGQGQLKRKESLALCFLARTSTLVDPQKFDMLWRMLILILQVNSWIIASFQLLLNASKQSWQSDYLL